MAARGERRASEEEIFLRDLPRQYLVRANQREIEGRPMLLGRAFRLPSSALCQHYTGESVQGG